ncbi:hypothetical protein F5Y15DRAFT_264812 [Xylariaceae sp. FL0016]|nr:hypothetical protein F5Y15DRAFT_264812 [Xylariaceae sp. FL0016]
MLEKTAASLEPCGFQRVFPGATAPFRSTRQLHTTFWQHGATDLELSNAWQALMHGTFDHPHDQGSEPDRSPSLTASGFLLDFLYPSGAVALMRRLNPMALERHDSLRIKMPFANASRTFTSSIPRPRAHNEDSNMRITNGRRHPNRKQIMVKDNGSSEPSVSVRSKSFTGDSSPPDQGAEGGQVSGESQDVDTIEPDPIAPDSAHDHFERVDAILAVQDLEDADRLWYHFRNLDEQSRDMYRARVLIFLSRTGRLSDSWKISELFNQLEPISWDDYTFVAGITAEVNLQNTEQALGVFANGLKHTSLGFDSLIKAVDLLLAAALRSPTTEFLQSVWNYYPAMAVKWEFEGITPYLKQLASVPSLADKALAFAGFGEERLDDASGSDTDRQASHVLQRLLVRTALVSCKNDQVLALLNTTKDPLAFEEVLRNAVTNGRKTLAPDIYKVYRELPNCTPTKYVLHEVFKAYVGTNMPISARLSGLEVLWGDWHRFIGQPSRRAYQRYMAFYASRGDKERVYDLWVKFIEIFRSDKLYPVLQGSDTFSHLLQVHAVNGEAVEAQNIFDDVKQKFGITPSLYHWNILLDAYAKAGDYGGLISAFEGLSAATKPDQVSYGVMMRMAGDRGDLGYTVDLYRQARYNGILANDYILCALIDAYCQNNHLKEAEDVCVRAANKGIRSTRLWNKLLHYYALQRDLTGLNMQLNRMAENKIPYNEFTYQELLFGLSLCRQSQHALRLLTVALKEHIFQVNPSHFQIVMGALLATGEPSSVKRLHKLMLEHGYQSSSATLFRLSQALVQWKALPPQERKHRSSVQWFGKALRSFYQMYGLLPGERHSGVGEIDRSEATKPKNLLRPSLEVSQIGMMVSMFTQLKDYVRSRELVDLYRFVYQRDQDDQNLLPVTLLNSVLRTDLNEGRHTRLLETWRVLFTTAQEEGRSKDFKENHPRAPKISARYRYALASGLRTMQEYFLIQADSTGLQELVQEVQAAGFIVDNMNWNYHVQALIKLKQYQEAFAVCEKKLMPNWAGWAVVRSQENVKNQLALDMRRKGLSSRYLRPDATTLYHLAKGYMELDRMTIWSTEAATMVKEVEEKFVQAVRAIKSMIRVHSSLEQEIFGSSQSSYALDPDEIVAEERVAPQRAEGAS